MPKLTARDYIELGDRYIRAGRYEEAIVQYSKALQTGMDNRRAEEALQNAYTRYAIQGLELIERARYEEQHPRQAERLALPQSVAYILRGTNQLIRLPEFAGIEGEPDAEHVDFELLRKYPVLSQCGFAVDFSECSNLEDIPSLFFSNLGNLVYADLSGCDRLSRINDSVFAFCNSLQTVIFPRNLRQIGQLAFQGAALRQVDLSGTNVRLIDGGAFNCNAHLTKVILSPCLEEIGKNAFSDCFSLEKLENFTPKLKEFAPDSLLNCRKLQILRIPDGFGEFAVAGARIALTDISREHYKAAAALQRYFCYKEATASLNKGSLFSAYSKLKDILNVCPNHRQVLFECGYACLHLHKYDEAGELFGRLIDIGCRDYEIIYNAYIGRARSNMPFIGREEDVIRDLSMAIGINNSAVECYMQRSIMYSRLGRLAQAQQDYEAAVRLDGTYKFFGFELIKAENYRGKMQLPEGTEYVVKGAPQLVDFPCLGRVVTIERFALWNQLPNRDIGYISRLGLEEMHPELLNSKFALDLSECRKFEGFKTWFFMESKNIVAADLSGCRRLKHICPSCFENCTNLETVIFNRELMLIRPYAFAGCGLKKLDFSNNIAQEFRFECNAFQNNVRLEEIRWPNRLIAIDSNCFDGCTSLSMVSRLPICVRTIGKDAFNSIPLKEIETEQNPDDANEFFTDIGVKFKNTLKEDEELFIEGREASRLSGFKSAIDSFDRCLKCNENNVQARLYRGYSLLRIWRSTQVLKLNEAPIVLQQSNAQSEIQKVRVLRNWALDRALQDFSRVLQQSNDQGIIQEAHVLRAFALAERNSLLENRRTGNLFGNADKNNFNNDDKQLILSDLNQYGLANFDYTTWNNDLHTAVRAYSICGNYDKAVDIIQMVLDNNPDNFEITMHLGVAKYKKKDYEGAIETFSRAEHLIDGRAFAGYGQAHVYYYRGRAEAGLGNFEGALRDYEQAYEQAQMGIIGSGEDNLRAMLHDHEGDDKKLQKENLPAVISDTIKETKQKIEKKFELKTADDLSPKKSRLTSRSTSVSSRSNSRSSSRSGSADTSRSGREM